MKPRDVFDPSLENVTGASAGIVAYIAAEGSTAQLISYELNLSSAILLVVLLAGILDITVIIEAQRAI
jgi:NADH:ubiquinone oxidoreductase subunit H